EGARELLLFEPPGKGSTSSAQPAPAAAASASTDSRRPERGGLSPAIAITGMVFTAAFASAAVWSGIDTLRAHDDFQRQSSHPGYDDGVLREHRTNLLIGATAIVGSATLGLALFGTGWSKAKVPQVPPAAQHVGVLPESGGARLFWQESFR